MSIDLKDKKKTDIYGPLSCEELKRFGAENAVLFLVYLLFSAALLYWGACLNPAVGAYLNIAYGEGLAPVSILLLATLAFVVAGIARFFGGVSYARRDGLLVLFALAPTRFLISLMLTYFAYLIGFIVACYFLEFPIGTELWSGVIYLPLSILFVSFMSPRVFFKSCAFKCTKGENRLFGGFIVLIPVLVAIFWVTFVSKPADHVKAEKTVALPVMCWYGKPAFIP
ncbi:hypothetical protein F0169_25300 [Pseudomonas sp. MAFF 212408]|uniref:Yip1 domain-containing protein n=1 Tax=Pseudomonas kitaguniensis TaxID=2607908 RepID=A0A5N7KSB7_9PSED|nr:hypothetical protein [Pseudomonas kitaguniensis]MPR05096.1 hypothetical protein [Pseudomonas kitaguniensis]